MPSLTLTFSTIQANRIERAYKDIYKIDPFGAPELKALLIEEIKDTVRSWEEAEAGRNLNPANVPIS